MTSVLFGYVGDPRLQDSENPHTVADQKRLSREFKKSFGIGDDPLSSAASDFVIAIPVPVKPSASDENKARNGSG